MTQHLDLDQLADLQEGLLDADAEAAAAAHVGGCAACSSDVEALAALRQELAAAPDVGPMPDDVAARLDAALAAELAAAVAAPAEAPDEAGEVIPMPTPATRRWWSHHRVLQAAAVAVLVIAGGAIAVPTLNNAGSESATTAAKGGMADAGAPEAATQEDAPGAADEKRAVRILSTGTQYDDETLAAQVTELVAAPVAAAAPGPSSDALRAADDAQVDDPGEVAACLAALPTAATSAVLVDNAQFRGQPVTVFVLEHPDDPGRLSVWVVTRGCATGDAQILHRETIQRP